MSTCHLKYCHYFNLYYVLIQFNSNFISTAHLEATEWTKVLHNQLRTKIEKQTQNELTLKNRSDGTQTELESSQRKKVSFKT